VNSPAAGASRITFNRADQADLAHGQMYNVSDHNGTCKTDDVCDRRTAPDAASNLAALGCLEFDHGLHRSNPRPYIHEKVSNATVDRTISRGRMHSGNQSDGGLLERTPPLESLTLLIPSWAPKESGSW
jgi:hypothetical protein